jgi:ribonucleoside-diphosphate reductase alpha chain
MVNGGIEPFFAIAYQRMLGDGRKLTYVNPLFEQIARERGFWSEKLIERISKKGSVKGMRSVPKDVRELFVTAHEVKPEQHVRILAAFQEFTDNAVSKTINLPHEATVDDVKRCIKLAYDLDCKGLTLYRDGSRRVQVLTAGTEDTGESCSLHGGCDRCD